MLSGLRENDSRRGILFMLLAMAAFVVNDTFVKLASEAFPPGQIIFLRGLVATPFLALLAWRGGVWERPSLLRHRMVTIRTVSEMGATALYVSALLHMPLANASAIMLLVPLVVTAGAAVLLHEHVGLRLWLAVALGFLGVLLIVRPGASGFDVWALVALASVAFVAARDLSSRSLPRNVPTLGVTALSSVAVLAIGAGMGVFEDWAPIWQAELLHVCLAAVLLSCAYILIVLAMRAGAVAIVSPFRYSIMLWAVLVQVVVFATWPDMLTLLGSAILIATGIYAFRLERIHASVRPSEPPGPERQHA